MSQAFSILIFGHRPNQRTCLTRQDLTQFTEALRKVASDREKEFDGMVMLFNIGEPFVGEGFGGKEPGLREFPHSRFLAVTNEHRVEARGACSSKMATNGAASFVAVPAEIRIEKGWARSEGPCPCP
jgi:hypothetical protein